MTTCAAVLTGDLIGSTEGGTDRIEQSMKVLRKAAARITETTNSDTRFTRYRGDGWQIYLENPGDFLWAAVFLTAVLKANPQCLPTRIGIGLGTAAGLDATDLSSASGTAFINSGRALDEMMVGATLDLKADATDDIQRAVIYFIDDLMSGWTQEQAEAVGLILTPGTIWTQARMADELGISRQAVGARLKAARFARINDTKDAFYRHFVKR